MEVKRKEHIGMLVSEKNITFIISRECCCFGKVYSMEVKRKKHVGMVVSEKKITFIISLYRKKGR